MQQTRTLVIRALIALAIAHGAAAQTAPTVVISPTPKLAFFDNNGKPLAGGCVATYAAGTTTPLQTFTDATGMVPNQNPVMLDASGRAGIWISVPSIKYVVKAKSSACSLSSGTILYTVDHVQDSGLLLRSDLAGANGAGNIGIQQPGGIPITVGAALQLCPDASQYASLASAIANAVPSGCLTVSSVFTATAVTIPSNFVLNCQPGSSISNNTATATLTMAAAATNVTLTGCNVSNTGTGQAIFSPTSCTNCTVEGGRVSITGNTQAISFIGSWSNIHVTKVAVSDTGDGTFGEAISLHCTLATSVCNGAWVENNDITHGNQDFAIEFGCFCPSPYPAPTNVHVLGNHVTAAAGYAGPIAGAVSASTATNSEIASNRLNTNLTTPVGLAGYEIASSSKIDTHDNTWINPAGGLHQVFICNGCSASVFQRNVGAGFATVYSGGNPGTGANTLVSHVELGGNILLPAAANEPGINVECNGALNNMDSINVHDNFAFGSPSTSFGLVLSNDSGCSYTNVTNLNNVFDGFANGVVANGVMSGIRHRANTYLHLTGAAYGGTQTPETQADNNQPWIVPQPISAPGITLIGTAPTFTAGTGAGTSPTGPGCLSSVTCSPFRGTVNVLTGTAPASNGKLFSINVAAGYYSAMPTCLTGTNPFSIPTPIVVFDNIGSTTTRLDFYVLGGALPAAQNVNTSYLCMK